MQPAPMIGSKDERTKRANNILYSKRHLIEFCLAESSNFLSIQKYQLAVPAASQALKFCRELDGDTSILLVEPYLQLGRASYGLKQYKQCEEYLSLAQWIVLNSDRCADITRSRLHQLLGRLHATQRNYVKAKEEFSKSIYYSSRCYGAESIATSLGYFSLGEVFISLEQAENAVAFFDKVVDIWYKFLSALLTRVDASRTGADPENNIEQLSEESIAEGRSQLVSVIDYRKQLLGENHIASGEALFTIGIFDFFLLGQQFSAEEFIKAAYAIYQSQLGSDHPSTTHVDSVLSQVKLEGKSVARGGIDSQSQFAESQEFNYVEQSEEAIQV